GPEGTDKMFTGLARPRLHREVALDRMTQELKRHSDAPNPVTSFFFWNRTRRKIATHSYRILARVGEVFSPYLDHDVFDLLSGLPPEVFLDHTFHTEAIHRAYPRYAALPFAAKKEPRMLSADHAPLRVFGRDVVAKSLQ